MRSEARARFVGREVSCLPIANLLDSLRRRGLSAEKLLEGVPYSLEHLSDPARRLDWSSYRKLLENAGRLWTDAELEEIARSALRLPLLRPLARVGRLVFSPKSFYLWAANDTVTGDEPYYACSRSSVRDLGENRLLFEITLEKGYARPREHFVMAKGVLSGLPTMLGFGAAAVKMEETQGGARYWIELPSGGWRLLGSFLSLLLWPLWGRSVVAKLHEAQELLYGRYQELEAAHRSEREAHTLLRQLAENLREIPYIHDARGEKILFAGSAYEDVWGRSREPLYRDGTAWMDAIHPDDRERVAMAWWRDCATGSYHQEYRIVRPDGTERWISDRAVPVLNDSGEVERIVGIAEDITARKSSLDELRRAKLAAEAASRAKSEFLANVSHEIRSPMTAILGYAELLLEELRSEGGSAARVEALRTIKRNGAYLLELIDDILDLSRVESGRVSIHRVAFSPAQVLADVRSLLAPRAREKGVVFTARRGPGVPERVVSDPLRLRQVLINVVGNAVKFTDSGSVSVTLECVEREGQPWLSFRVSDTGPGIAEDQLERVFEPLYQIDGSPTRRHPGVGLGLAIAKRLCRGLGGTIEVASRPGAGSTFWILIPATRPSGAESAAEASEETEAEGSVPWLGGLRLLVAEDASDTRVLLEDLLRRRGALVEAAKNGEQAVRLAMDALDKGCPFDAILMDVQMPVLDGYAATRVLRALGCKVPILAVTAYAMAEDRERCMAAGFDDYVAKPIDGAALGRALWSRVGQARGSAPTVAPPGPPGTGESSSEEAARRASHGR